MPFYFEHVDELDAQLATSAASKKLRSRRDLVAIFKELNVRIRKDKLKQMMAVSEQYRSASFTRTQS